MTERTEIWVWTVWEVAPVEVATEAAAGAEAEPAPEVAGYAVEASDGHIGTVDEVSYDAGSGSIVVDTGHWIFGRKRMIPAGMIEKIDSESRVVTLSCSKADVKAAPDYDAGRADDAAHRDEVGEHYRAQRDPGGSGSEAGTEPH